MIKPESLKNGIVGSILSYFESAGMDIVQIESVIADKNLIEAHYIEHKGKSFFDGLVARFTDQRVIAIELYKEDGDIIKEVRAILGATMPAEADKGTIRGDFNHIDEANETDDVLNLVHASDSVGAARRELSLWFPQEIDEEIDIDALVSGISTPQVLGTVPTE
jgi:nucleoside-diphosphate kinase